jgi:hypothetical protein
LDAEGISSGRKDSIALTTTPRVPRAAVVAKERFQPLERFDSLRRMLGGNARNVTSPRLVGYRAILKGAPQYSLHTYEALARACQGLSRVAHEALNGLVQTADKLC